MYSVYLAAEIGRLSERSYLLLFDRLLPDTTSIYVQLAATKLR